MSNGTRKFLHFSGGVRPGEIIILDVGFGGDA
jgi:hypothetical protein